MSVGPWNLLITLKMAFGCLLFTTVFAMAVVDLREMILPDRLNALLAGGGVGQSVFIGQPQFADAALGAFFGFVVLSTVAAAFRHIRGIDSLGFGDQKFAAAAGLWIGWEGIGPMLLIASCSALTFILIRSVGRKFDKSEKVPFGPFLGLGTVTCWLFVVATGS